MARPGTFKPGQSGNPAGRPPLPAWVREARKKSSAELITFLESIGKLAVKDVEEALEDPTLTIDDAILFNWVLESLKDKHSRKELVERKWGPVKQQIELEMIKPFIVHKSDGSQVVLGIGEKDKDEGQER